MLSISLIVSVLVSVATGARILAIFPTPSISHQVVFRPLTQELAKRGHEVTIITTDPAFQKGQAPPNITEINVHDISYDLWRDKLVKVVFEGDRNDLKLQVETYFTTILDIVIQQFHSDGVQKLVKDKTKKFDLLFLEACVRPALLYSHIYKVPVIQISSFGAMPGNLAALGAPVHPILYPNVFRQRSNNLTIWEKNKEILKFYLFHHLFKYYEDIESEEIIRHVGADIPPLSELYKNVDMLFLNVHPVFEGIRPVPPNVVYMGGMHQNPIKELPEELKSFLDNSKHGVIYISFGTNVDTNQLLAGDVKKMINVLSQLPYDVLLKWDGKELPGRAQNIRIAKWLPQSDLLRHPNIKLFITQGGLQSTDEAITAGVPMVGIPMLGDQWYNVERYEYHKIGIKVDLETLEEDKLRNAIITVIGDESYRRNVVKLRTLMNDQPMTPLERAVWWTEHVLRHGGARHLRSPAANMSWTNYLDFEVVLTLLITFLILVFIFISLVYYVCINYVTSKKLKAA
nr:UDP-glycosyltransferase UGT5-like [Helicoverpa armigera]WRX06264.1 UGT33F2B [Helicoverpa armigera]